jgi:hypothetical protein
MTVYIDSPGGDLETAISIGRQIREHGFWTSIGTFALSGIDDSRIIFERIHQVGKCLSAATIIYLGGSLRNFPEGSSFGVHRFSFKNPLPSDLERSQVLSAAVAVFINDMGISPAFLRVSSAVDAKEIKYMSAEELRELRVVTGGQTAVRWSVEARNSLIYVKGEQHSIYGHHKIILGFNKYIGFLFWAVIDSQNRAQELTSFRVVEITLNGEAMKFDISDNCERLVVGSDVHVFAKISLDQAKLISQSTSFGLQIKFGRESPVFLGIGEISTKGGVEQLLTLYKSFS